MHKIKLIIIGIILFFVSTIFIEEFSFYQITPSLLLPWVIYISFTFDYKFNIILTFFLSLALDIINPQLLGFNTLLLLLISHFTFIYNKSINKDKIISVILSLFLLNFVYYIIQWFYFAVSFPNPIFLLGKILLTVLYNTVLSFMLIYLIAIIDKLKLVLNE